MLSGLVSRKSTIRVDKVPGLGDIPILGNLFKSETRNRQKDNLMVFLRPTVIRDNDTLDALASDRYDMMRKEQADINPQPKVLMPNVSQANLMPALSTAVPPERSESKAQVPPPLSMDPAQFKKMPAPPASAP